MNRIKIITGFLVFSFLLNVFLLTVFVERQSTNIEREKVIIMNEFSERAKEWRNFTQFVNRLSEKENEHFPIKKEESDLYWELAKPMESIIMKTTDQLDADYDLYGNYVDFFIKYDVAYSAIINLFKSRLPLMKRDQMLRLSTQLDESYDLFIREAIGDWSVSGQSRLDIHFEPKEEKLNLVIQKLAAMKEEIESIE